MIKVKFPSGHTASELFHYMGADDEVHFSQRPEVAQRLINKCETGKTIELFPDELQQLIKEVDNMLDIKSDRDGDGWTALQQHNLSKYLSKLKAL